MKVKVMTYTNYKTYIKDWIASQPRNGYGVHKKIATSIKCQTPYLSNVLNGNAHFSPEQADRFNSFVGHNEVDAHLFHMLVAHNKAGTATLKAYYNKQIANFKNNQLDLKKRIKSQVVMDELAKTEYFGNWLYSAIHVLLTIDSCRELNSLVEKSQVPRQKIREILDFLCSKGLVQEKAGRFTPTTAQMHLANDAPQIVSHHTNWRLQALKNFQQNQGRDDFHYSSVISVSDSDFFAIKRILVDNLSSIKEIIQQSKGEKLVGFNIDFFEEMKR